MDKINELETLPAYDANRFFRRIAEMTEEYFKDPKNQKGFEEWKKKRRKAQKEGETDGIPTGEVHSGRGA